MRRAHRRPGRPRRPGDGLQRSTAGPAADITIGAVGPSAGRWRSSARRPTPGVEPERGISRDGRWRCAGRGQRRAAGSARSRRASTQGTSNVGPVTGGPTAAAPATRPTSSPITSRCTANPAATTPSSSGDHHRLQGRLRGRRGVNDHDGKPAKVTFASGRTTTRSGSRTRRRWSSTRARRCGGRPPPNCGRQRRAGRQLVGQARHPDRDLRGRSERDPHGRRVGRPGRVRTGLRAGGGPGDEGESQRAITARSLRATAPGTYCKEISREQRTGRHAPPPPRTPGRSGTRFASLPRRRRMSSAWEPAGSLVRCNRRQPLRSA